MKLYIILIGLLFILKSGMTQSRYDYYWPQAIDRDGEVPGVQAFALDFNTRPFEPVLRDSELDLGQNNASICDACLLYTSPSPRDGLLSRMPSSA